MDAFKFIDRYPNEVFNLIFLDPPYRQELIPRVIQSIKDFAYLTPDGVIVAETAKDEDLTGVIYPFEIRKTGEYGDTKIWYLQRMDV